MTIILIKLGLTIVLISFSVSLFGMFQDKLNVVINGLKFSCVGIFMITLALLNILWTVL